MRVTLLHRGFDQGGAERQVAVTAVELVRRGHAVQVVVFHDGDAYRSDLEQAGIVPEVVGGSRGRLPLDLRRSVRGFGADAVLSYLAGPNELSLLLRTVGSRPLLVWGVRSTTLDLADETPLGRAVYRIEPRLSHFADAVVSNSEAGRRDAIGRGFRPMNFEVIPNGIDVERFVPAAGGSAAARRALGLDEERVVIGLVGRLHPVKGVPDVLRALAGMECTGIELALVGSSDGAHASEVRSLVSRLGLGDVVRFVGPAHDAAEAYRAFDLLVSPSLGEGFSNVIAEAMASGLPCVATDVGDNRLLIGDSGILAPVGDVGSLRAGLAEIVAASPAERRQLGVAARDRICRNYSVEALGDRLEGLLEALLAQRRRRDC